MTYRRDRYDYHRSQERKILTLTGTTAEKIQQVIDVLKPFYIDHTQVGDNWVLRAKRPNGTKVTIINATRLACLRDLATIHNYELN